MLIEAVVVVVKDSNDRVLLLKRSEQASHFPNKWGLPGGKIDNGESIMEAAFRELEEETGITKVVLMHSSALPTTSDGKFLIHPVLCLTRVNHELDEGMFPNKEHSTYNFFSEEDRQKEGEVFGEVTNYLVEFFNGAF